MKSLNVKKLIIRAISFVLFFYLFGKVGQAFRLAQGADLSGKLMNIQGGFTAAFAVPLPSFHPQDMLVGIVGAAIIVLMLQMKKANAKKYRKGVEYGSARWGTSQDWKPFTDPVFEKNILLTQTEWHSLNGQFPNAKDAKNKNIICIGGSGTGKTRFFCKPNLMQMHSSYVVTDPKGTILLECGKLLQRGSPVMDEKGKPVLDKNGKRVYSPYRIKILNLIDFSKSMRYNPFVYIRKEEDIMKLVNTLIANTKGEGEKSAEDFWVKAERLYFCALIGYIWYEAPAEEKNFITLLEMLNASETREDDEEYQNPVDLMFERLAEKDPGHFAVRQYVKYKMAAGKTAKSILISCGARTSVFDLKALRELMEYDELEIDTLGDEKTALFVIIPDTDDTFNFIAAMMYTQMFNLLCDKADGVYNGRLPVHVRCILESMHR